MNVVIVGRIVFVSIKNVVGVNNLPFIYIIITYRISWSDRIVPMISVVKFKSNRIRLNRTDGVQSGLT
jgi:hypothetical protein